jgi:hypothetical protein
VSTIEELLGRKSSDSGLENRNYGRRGSAALTKRHSSIRRSWPTSGGCSVGIVPSRTQATEFSFNVVGPIWSAPVLVAGVFIITGH